jgi:hypothetical protein
VRGFTGLRFPADERGSSFGAKTHRRDGIFAMDAKFRAETKMAQFYLSVSAADDL